MICRFLLCFACYWYIQDPGWWLLYNLSLNLTDFNGGCDWVGGVCRCGSCIFVCFGRNFSCCIVWLGSKQKIWRLNLNDWLNFSYTSVSFYGGISFFTFKSSSNEAKSLAFISSYLFLSSSNLFSVFITGTSSRGTLSAFSYYFSSSYLVSSAGALEFTAFSGDAYYVLTFGGVVGPSTLVLSLF